jgi:Lipase (class 2)
MIGRFEKDGWPKSHLSAYSYNTSQSNKVDAEKEVKPRVESLLAATGASKVDIIAHSMGSLNSRWYVKFLGGESKVDEWVSLGGPNHGTSTANFCFSTACTEMRIGSTLLSETACVAHTSLHTDDTHLHAGPRIRQIDASELHLVEASPPRGASTDLGDDQPQSDVELRFRQELAVSLLPGPVVEVAL